MTREIKLSSAELDELIHRVRSYCAADFAHNTLSGLLAEHGGATVEQRRAAQSRTLREAKRRMDDYVTELKKRGDR